MTTANPLKPQPAQPSPKLGIGLPVFNGENYLAEAIESLLGQTFNDFELVISDNASTDRTAEICQDFAAGDSRIRYERQEQNRGGIWNFNHAFSRCRGEYFKWAAHDDVCAPTFLERCIHELDNDPSVVWCHSETTPIDRLGRPIENIPHEQPSWASEPEISQRPDGTRPRRGRLSNAPHQRFRGVLLGRSYCLDIYGVIRRQALERTRLMLPFWGPEKVLIAELSLLGRYAEVPEPLFHFRFHPDASSCLPTVSEQLSWLQGGRRLRKWLASPRFQLLWGYATAAAHAPAGYACRARCLASVARYLLQLRKWREVVKRSVQGVGIGASGLALLDELERQKQAETPAAEAVDGPAAQTTAQTTAQSTAQSTAQRKSTEEQTTTIGNV